MMKNPLKLVSVAYDV